MASSIIHIAVANEINKEIKKDESRLLIGSIAPDISKHIGENKVKSHFQDEDNSIPNLDKFLSKYGDKLDDPFILGYYIHIYTDYLWFKYFIPEVFDNDTSIIKKLNGEEVKCNGDMKKQYIYNDYTNLNKQIIDEYELNFKIFYNEIPKFENGIDEIPMDKVWLLLDKTGLIVASANEHKNFIFDITNIKKFIETSVKLILSDVQDRLKNK